MIPIDREQDEEMQARQVLRNIAHHLLVLADDYGTSVRRDGTGALNGTRWYSDSYVALANDLRHVFYSGCPGTLNEPTERHISRLNRGLGNAGLFGDYLVPIGDGTGWANRDWRGE